jgi:hypothetical protein
MRLAETTGSEKYSMRNSTQEENMKWATNDGMRIFCDVVCCSAKGISRGGFRRQLQYVHYHSIDAATGQTRFVGRAPGRSGFAAKEELRLNCECVNMDGWNGGRYPRYVGQAKAERRCKRKNNERMERQKTSSHSTATKRASSSRSIGDGAPPAPTDEGEWTARVRRVRRQADSHFGVA